MVAGVRYFYSRRTNFLLLALLLVAGGIFWALLNEGKEAAGDTVRGIPTSGYVSSVRRDSIGCSAWIPFAAKDCRVVVRIHHRVGAAEQTTTLVEKRYLGSPPVAAGDPVSGTCSLSGRCLFDQLAERSFYRYGL